MTKASKDIIAGLDMGTSKVVVAIAEITSDGNLEIVGVGKAESNDGVKRGVINNIDVAVQSIQQALKEAENAAGCGTIGRVHASITGEHIQGFNSSVMMGIKKGEVTETDLRHVMDLASNVISVPSDQRVLMVEPQEYAVDGQIVQTPVGMSARRMDMNVHIVTGMYSAVENVIKCMRRCGLEIDQLMPNCVASSKAVLMQEERDEGVVLLDIGGGSTDIAVYVDGALRYTSVIPVAGNHITRDISIGLGTPLKDAELIKIAHGNASQTQFHSQTVVPVPGSFGDRSLGTVSPQVLAGIIGPRVEEILGLACQAVEQADYKKDITAVVLTGGSSLLQGMPAVAEKVFNRPARQGSPWYTSPLLEHKVPSACASTVVGLLQEARLTHLNGGKIKASSSWIDVAKKWMSGFFGNF